MQQQGAGSKPARKPSKTFHVSRPEAGSGRPPPPSTTSSPNQQTIARAARVLEAQPAAENGGLELFLASDQPFRANLKSLAKVVTVGRISSLGTQGSEGPALCGAGRRGLGAARARDQVTPRLPRDSPLRARRGMVSALRRPPANAEECWEK